MYLLGCLSEESLGGGVHVLGVCADTYGEAAGHVDADILARQGVGQIGINADGGERHVGVVLDYGPYELTATVYAGG